jgi:hypothetical protein
MKTEIDLCCGTVADVYQLRTEVAKCIAIAEQALESESCKASIRALQEILEILEK